MSTVTYKCPSCGGVVEYDAKSKSFVCRSCGTALPESAFQSETDTASSDGVLYACPTCGAQLMTDSTTAATECYYCHSAVVLSGRLSDNLRPHIMIPFKIDKNAAFEKYRAWIKGKKYLPRDFFYEGQIENIQGVYYPFWVADYRGVGSFAGEGRIVTTTTTPREIIKKTDVYRVVREGSLQFNSVMRSALKKADRKLADGIHPYNLSALQTFSMPYMSGYMAEARDVEDEDIAPDVEREVKSYSQQLLTRGARYTTLSGTTNTRLTAKRYRYALFPAWVMTYRQTGGKLCYFAMNGQTGKICGRLPTSRGKLWGLGLLVFSIAFVILCIAGYLFL